MKHATKIEWTMRPGTKGETLNPIRARNLETGGIGHFCQHVSPGCSACYAERLQPRFRNPIKYRPQDRDKVEIYLDEEVLTRPLHWDKPRTIFWCSMTDYAAPWVLDEWLDKIFAVCALTPQHTHQLLTKYPERVRAYFATLPMRSDEPDRITDAADTITWGFGRGYRGSAGLADRPLPNLWLGTSCEDQRRLDERWPHLRDTPAAVRFISYEPALEAIDFSGHDITGLHWTIAGGESVGRDEGGEERLIDWDWFRFTRDQCWSAGVAFFCKQGNKGPGWKDPIPEDLQIHEWPEVGA